MDTLGNNLVAFSGNKMASKYHSQKFDYECSKNTIWKIICMHQNIQRKQMET